MPTSLRCPRGHSWELDDSESAAAAETACPFCGTVWLPGAETTGRPDPAPAPVLAADTDGGPPVRVPGYEILDELGAGGMGVVYRARQIRTDRVVALKVPHASALDLAARVRFLEEARSAARLQHPGIVQVFEVGEVDRRPYLSLEYCPGGSLADQLDGTPLPPRTAAELVEAVARAVAAAHAAGVVHRDLKPENILLQRFTAEGAEGAERKHDLCSSSVPSAPSAVNWVPKVADFGLARRTDADLGPTLPGEILGTPSYMAPEQAGGPKPAGPSADVYALGAVLYELLTGRPPFRGTTVFDTLDQVRTREPVPPSRLQPTVPRDLETIALACLRKEPGRRYPSADSLADDLRRFLDGRPVLARPVGWPERLLKLARRNPLPTTLLAALAAAVGAGIGVGAWKQVRLAAERDRARVHFQTSMRAIDELLTEVAEEDLAAEPRAELKRQALLEKALRFYQELLRVEAGDPAVEWEAARAARRVGDIDRLLGRYPDALAAYDRATARLEQLRAGGRDDSALWQELALCHNWRGEVHRLNERVAAADDEYRQAAAIQTRLLAEEPGHLQFALELAQSLYNRGIVAGDRGRYAEAADHFRRAAEPIAAARDRSPECRRHAARVALNLADVLRQEGRPAAAAAAAADAVAAFDALLAEHPARPDYRHERSAAGINLALARAAAGDVSGAVAAAGDARRRLEELVRDFPATALFRADLARACTALAALAYAHDRRAAEDHTRAAVGHWEALLAARPGVSAYHGELGLALGNLGRLAAARPDEARGHLTRGVDEVLVALRANPDAPDFRRSLRQQTRDLADHLVRAGDDRAVADLAGRIRDGLPGHPHGTHRAVCFLARCAAVVRATPGPDADRRADGYARQALDLIRDGDATTLSPLLDDPDADPFRALPAFRAALGR